MGAAEQLHGAVHGPRIQGEAVLHGGDPGDGVLPHDTQVTGQGELAARADRGALDIRDDRHRNIGDRGQHLLQRGEEVVGVDPAFEVRPGTESRAFTTQQDGADAAAGGGVLQCRGELRAHLSVQRISAVRSGQGDHRHPPVDLQRHRVLCHADHCPPFSWSASGPGQPQAGVRPAECRRPRCGDHRRHVRRSRRPRRSR